MNSYVDIPVFLIFAILFMIGWLKGFWRTILGPISLMLGMIISYMYYFETQKFLMSLIISIVAPFILNFLFNYIFSLVPKKKESEDISLFSLWNHLFGGIFHTVWHGIIILLILLTFVILPVNFSWLNNLKAEIKNSLTYTHLLSPAVNLIPNNNSNLDSITKVLENPKNIERVRGTKEYDSIMEDNRVKNIIEDESLIDKIRNKDYMEIINNSKIQELLKDPDLIKKFFKLNEKIITEAQENWQGPRSVFNH